MVLWDRPRRRRTARRSTARSLAWRVEALEERFLLAKPVGTWYSLPVGSTPAVVDQSALSDVPSEAPAGANADAEASDPTVVSGIQIAFGSDVASPKGFNVVAPITETTSVHSTLLTAQDVPEETAIRVLGKLAPGDDPDVFRIPLEAFPSFELFISLSWADPDVTGLGTLTILDSSANVLMEQGLPSDPVAVDLRFSHVSDAPGASLYIKIAAADKSAWGDRDGANYVLRTAPTELLPSAMMIGTDPTGQPPTGGESETNVGFPPPSDPPPSDPTAPVPPPTEDSATAGPSSPVPTSTSSPPRVELPLPQAGSPPAGGIFVAKHMSSAPVAGGAFAVVADTHMLDLAPARSGPPSIPVGGARAITVHLGKSPTPNTSLTTSWGVEARGDELVADTEDESASSEGADASPLVLVLPPSGIRTGDQVFPDPAAAVWLGDRAPLPRLTDASTAPEPARPRDTAIASQAGSRRRPGALLALLYGSACSLLGLSAPELSVVLRRVARRGLESELTLGPNRRTADSEEEGAGEATRAFS